MPRPPPHGGEIIAKRISAFPATLPGLGRAFTPRLHWDVLADGRVAYSDSSDYAVKIADAGRGVVRVVRRPFLPEPVTDGAKRAERERRRERPDSVGNGWTMIDPGERLHNLEFFPEVPVIRGLAVTWDGHIWVLRRGEEPTADGPIDVLAPEGRYLGSYRAGTVEIPEALRPGRPGGVHRGERTGPADRRGEEAGDRGEMRWPAVHPPGAHDRKREGGSRSFRAVRLDWTHRHGHYRHMKRVSVSEAKNELKRAASEVRCGEAVLITHREKPVARIEPCRIEGPGADDATAELLSRGVAVPPRASLDVERFLGVPVPRLTGGAAASEIIVAEREASR